MDLLAGAPGGEQGAAKSGEFKAGKREVEARAVALNAERNAVRAIEAAMLARLAGDASRFETEKAKAVMAGAQQASEKANEAAERAVKEKEDADKAASDAILEMERATQARDEAEANVSKLKNAKKTVVEETALLEAEMKAAKAANTAAEKENVVLASKAREAMQQVKYATRTKEKAETTSKQANDDLQTKEAEIVKKEAALAARTDEAAEIARRVYPKQEEEEELAEAVAMAERAAAEYAGTGSTWEARTLETLKERQNEHSKAKSELDMAKKAEENANAAVATAQKTLEAANRAHEAAVKRSTQEAQALEEANTALTEQTKAANEAQDKSEQARKESAEAMARQEAMAEKLKNLKISSSGAAMASAEEDARRANEVKETSERVLGRMQNAATVANEAMHRALTSKEAAISNMEAKRAATAKALEKEEEADKKREGAEEAIKELEDEIKVLAQAELDARGLEMAPQEQKDAEEVSGERKEVAMRDIRFLTKIYNTDKITAVDKWRAFRQWVEEGQHGSDLWNVRRLFYALDGSVLSSLDCMVKDIVGHKLDRGSVTAKLCKVDGEGLSQAALGQTSSFTIFAYSTHGIRFDKGGDVFSVGIRYSGLAMRVRTKIVDNNDGSYTVSFKPTSSGKCSISVTYEGDALPGSPFTCSVSAPTPCASQCLVSGDAINTVTAHKPEHFFIGFRDALGQVAHAGELDVWVHPVEGDKSPRMLDKMIVAQGVEVPNEVTRLIEPLGEFEYLVVGSKAVDVTRARDPESEKIGRVTSGKALKLVRIEPPTEEGVLRACILIDSDEPKDAADPHSWRELWPQKQDWRAASKGPNRKKLNVIAAASTRLAIEENAATRIASVYKGKSDRKLVLIKIEEREAERKAAARAAQEAAVRAAQEAKQAKAAASNDDDRKLSGGKGKARPSKAPASPTKGGKEPAPDASKGAAKKTPAKKGGKEETKEDKPPADAKAKGDKGSGKEGGKDAKTKAAAKAAEEAAKLAAAEEEAKAAQEAAVTKINASVRGVLARRKLATDRATGEQAPAAANPKRKKSINAGDGTPTKKGAKGKKKAATKPLALPTNPPPTASAPESPTPPPPGTSLSLSSRQPEKKFGWVTLAMREEPLVTRQTRRLPAHVRQQYLQNWTRRVAIDSDRERERALMRDRDAEEGYIKGTEEVASWIPPYLTGGLLSGRGYSPRPGYVPDDTEAKGVGFAYGGVYPGRLHAKGQLIETHEVHFSVGVAGNYLLYVSLRQPNGQSSPLDNVPGSPFFLHVAPGPAHPLSTLIPATALPLRGGPATKGMPRKFACELSIPTFDKMGNRCTSGGSKVTCGFLDATPNSAAEEEAIVEKRNSTCTDNGDGIYVCKWFADAPGEFHAYIKINGLHILGSPALLKFTQTGADGRD